MKPLSSFFHSNAISLSPSGQAREIGAISDCARCSSLDSDRARAISCQGEASWADGRTDGEELSFASARDGCALRCATSNLQIVAKDVH